MAKGFGFNPSAGLMGVRTWLPTMRLLFKDLMFQSLGWVDGCSDMEQAGTLLVVVGFNPSAGLMGVRTDAIYRVWRRGEGFNPSAGLMGVRTRPGILCLTTHIRGFNPSAGLMGVRTRFLQAQLDDLGRVSIPRLG